MTFLERPEGRLAIALGIGLLIGAERERRKGEGPMRAGAGIRTFAVVALLGGVAALIGSEALLVVVALVVGGIAMAGYALGEREDPGFTTEIADPAMTSPVISVRGRDEALSGEVREVLEQELDALRVVGLGMLLVLITTWSVAVLVVLRG